MVTADSIDKDLLAVAKAAGEQLAAAEQQVDVARADYHHAVRRLHLAGAPLRDVAQALGISHQRVQQIVQARGGTWWSRVWRGRKVRPDMLCSFCGRPAGQVAKLIAGPRVYICDACVSAAERALRGETPAATGIAMSQAPPDRRVRCSFCSKRACADLKILTTGDNNICGTCLDLCRRILDDRSQAHDPADAHA